MCPQFRRSRRRRRRLLGSAIAVAALVGGAGSVTAALAQRISGPAAPPPDAAGTTAESASAAPSPSRSASPSPSPSPTGSPVPADFPTSGPGTWGYASGESPVLGTAGPIRRYRVAVESNIAIPPDDFAAKVDQTLGDDRSWIAGGQYRLQRVPGNAGAEFTVYLATRGTSTWMCAAGGLDTGGYTSCRVPGRVIINLDRWYTSVPDYTKAGTPLDTYRTYVINHETGHQLGHGHELCPGAGRPAPVMEQQTLGLHGCTANPWPYLDGQRYAGPPGQYGNG